MSRRTKGIVLETDAAFVDRSRHDVTRGADLSEAALHELESRARYRHLPADQQAAIDRLLRGNVDVNTLPRLPKRTVSLYVSSTYTDFNVEKDALLKETFPELRAYCRQSLGIDLQIVDPCWGQAELTNVYHTNADLFRDHMKQGDLHLILLGDKLGVSELRRTIPWDVFTRVCGRLEAQGEDITDLRTWYREDTNTLHGPEAVLQPVHSVLGVSWEEREWRQLQRRLCEQIRRGAEAAVGCDDLTPAQVSLACGVRGLEGEILTSLEQPDISRICVLREISNIKENQTSAAAAQFVDLIPETSTIDEEARDVIKTTKGTLLREPGSDHRVLTSAVTWNEPTGVDDSHGDHVEAVCRHVYREVKGAIDQIMEGAGTRITDSLYQENLRHWTRAEELSRRVFGREEELATIQAYLSSKTTTPLLLSGESGQGKSTLMALVASNTQEWMQMEGHSVNVSLITRFCGLTENSRDCRLLLQDVCRQVAYCTGSNTSKIPYEHKHQRNYLRNILQTGNFRGVLVLLLDGVDQLSFGEARSKFDWLPYSFANNVKVILSSFVHSDTERTLRKRYPNDESNLTLHNLDPVTAVELLTSIAESRGRRLSQSQIQFVEELCSNGNSPLTVESIASIVETWHSYEPLQRVSCTAEENLLELLSKLEQKYPQVFVKHALGYVTLSGGLSEAELFDVLCLDDKVLDCLKLTNTNLRRFPTQYWFRLAAELDSFVKRREWHSTTILKWRHARVHETARKRYCSDVNHLKYLHSVLADYYQGRGSSFARPTTPRCQQSRASDVRYTPTQTVHQDNQFNSMDCYDDQPNHGYYNFRKLEQLPTHLHYSGRSAELEQQVLFNFEWLHTKLKATNLFAVLQDYEQREAFCTQTRLVTDALRWSEAALKDEPDRLSSELLGRLLHYYPRYDKVRKLLYEADLIGNPLCHLVPTWQSYFAPGSCLEYVHSIGLSVYNPQQGNSKNGLFTTTLETKNDFVLFCKKPTSTSLYAWDINAAAENPKYVTCKGTAVHSTPDGQLIVCFTDTGTVKVYDADSSLLVYEVESGWSGIYPSHVALSSRYAAFMQPGIPGPYVLDVTAGTELGQLTYRCRTTAFTPDNRILAVHSETLVLLYEMPLMTKLCSIDIKASPVQFLWKSDRKSLFVLTENREVKVVHINYKYKRCTLEQIRCGNVDVQRMTLSHGEDQLLLQARYSLVLISIDKDTQGPVTIKDMAEDAFTEFKKPFTFSGFSHDDSLILASRGRYLGVWDNKGAPVRCLHHAPSDTIQLMISRYTNKVLTLHADMAMQLWNLDNLKESSPSTVVSGTMDHVAVAHRGSRVLCSTPNGSHVNVYNIATNAVEQKLQLSSSQQQNYPKPRISPTGRFAVTSSSNSSQPEFAAEAWSEVEDSTLWDLDGRRSVITVSNNRYTVFSPDDSHVVFCPCLEYDLEQPTLKMFSLVIVKVTSHNATKSVLQLKEGDICQEPVFFKNSKYLSWILCDSRHNTYLCLYSLSGTWEGVRYIGVSDILPNASPSQNLIDIKNISDESLVVTVGSGLSSMPYNDNNCFEVQGPVQKTGVLYNLLSGTKRVLEGYLTPDIIQHEAAYCQKSGVLAHKDGLWSAKTGQRCSEIPVQTNMVCFLRDNQYVAVVSASRKAVWVYRTSTQRQIGKVLAHGDILTISKAIDDITMVIACTDGRVVTYTLTAGESDAMTDVISKLASRRRLTNVTCPCDVIPDTSVHVSWREMMTQRKETSFQQLAACDVVDGNGIRAFLAL